MPATPDRSATRQAGPQGPALPPRPWRVAGAFALAVAVALLIALLLVAIAGAAAEQDAANRTTIDIVHLLAMSATQAGLTVVLSLVVGTALAWALNRLQFVGRALTVALFASAIVTPGIVVAFGVLAVWGRAGWVNEASRALFGVTLDIPVFGLGGILMAHVILDGAFAARVLLGRLDAIPAQRLKTGQALGLGAWQRFVVIDWPAIRGTLPGLGAVIFLLAFTSFPIVLLLGGGPANQTFEVAIYTAARLDFDLAAAVRLAVVQIGVCSVVVLLASAMSPVAASLGQQRGYLWQDRPRARVAQWLVLAASVIGFGLPLVAVLADGLGSGLASLLGQATFWRSLATSLAIATASAVLTMVLALAVTMGRAAASGAPLRIGLGAPAYAYLAVPAVVLSLGFFLLVRGFGIAPASAGPAVVVLANSLLALPFAVATLGPPLDAVVRTRGRLIRSLGLGGLRQFALVEWPLIARDAGLVFALAFCFSLGDLGVISLFGTPDFATLPLLMYRALGAYRTNDAAGIASLMLVLTITAFALLPHLFGRSGHARG